MSSVVAEIDRRIAPWHSKLGKDKAGYTNHILRVLAICDGLHTGGSDPPSSREEFLTAAAFHDLGIWSAGTFDYLAPSTALARDFLDHAGRTDLIPLVSEMIDQHHKIRVAADPGSPVELFRRADTTDILFGARSFGLSKSEYLGILRAHPDRSFHWRLITLTARRLASHPTSPLPMFKW